MVDAMHEQHCRVAQWHKQQRQQHRSSEGSGSRAAAAEQRQQRQQQKHSSMTTLDSTCAILMRSRAIVSYCSGVHCMLSATG